MGSSCNTIVPPDTTGASLGGLIWVRPKNVPGPVGSRQTSRSSELPSKSSNRSVIAWVGAPNTKVTSRIVIGRIMGAVLRDNSTVTPIHSTFYRVELSRVLNGWSRTACRPGVPSKLSLWVFEPALDPSPGQQPRYRSVMMLPPVVVVDPRPHELATDPVHRPAGGV